MKISEIKQRIAATGIAVLNPLQQGAAACTSDRIVMLAPTGTGKTLAFAIAMLRRMPEDLAGTGMLAVVVAPSRELVMQIAGVLRPLASPPFKVMAVYGGNSFAAETDSIAGAVPSIVVATPGRLLDHLQRGTLNASMVRVLVIDEYDKVVELGFREELRHIARRLERARVRILTSATRPDELPDFIGTGPVDELDFTQVDEPSGRLTVINVVSPARDKLDTLASLLNASDTGATMVFVNHRESAERVVESLKARGIPAVLYHGGMEQHDREIAVAKLRAGVARVMVCTDLAARGLDIDSGVDSVIHYHLPVDQKAWTHRNGRTARAGASGTVYVITTQDETVPEYIVADRDMQPTARADVEPRPAPLTMLYINAGKELKISRGDVAGFMMKVCGLPADAVGLITVARTYTLVAVPKVDAPAVIAVAKIAKLKGHRVKISEI